MKAKSKKKLALIRTPYVKIQKHHELNTKRENERYHQKELLK